LSTTALVSERQMDAWFSDLDSWDACDAVCGNLFDRTPFALDKAVEWTGREPEFERRAGFVLMACAAVHRKDLHDGAYAALLSTIRGASTDDRTYVKKAVSWALRQIGKRSLGLNAKAIRTAEQIGRNDAGASRWVARDALRELRSDAVQARLLRR
jgi:3-methyladenine DNA glycosylase AlkD